mgnify:CR=1 FL=1
MLKYFRGSFFVTIVGVILAYFWAEHSHAGSGLLALFIVAFLSILEVTPSANKRIKIGKISIRYLVIKIRFPLRARIDIINIVKISYWFYINNFC